MLTGFATFLVFLFIQFFFAFLIITMAVSFGINYGADLPDQVKRIFEEDS